MCKRTLTIPLCTVFALIAVASEGDVPPESLPENFVKMLEGVYSGGEPKSEKAFESLAAIGIRTIVSVDGLAPNVDLAQKYGIQYVHIPIGYDEISRESAAAMAKALKSRPGPHYIHCHHGRHRGPAIAAVAMRLLTGCADAAVTEWLSRAGVGKQYEGLWRDALAFQPEDITGMEVELHSIAPVSDLAGAMAAADRIWERLREIAAAGWKPLPEHPDLTPEREALMFHEAFREMARRTFDGFDDAEFATEMKEAETASAELLNALKAADTAKAATAADRVRKSCKSCHRTWRN